MKFSKEEIQQILDDMHGVRIEALQGESRELFYAIMQIADQRDEYLKMLKEIQDILVMYRRYFTKGILDHTWRECMKQINKALGDDKDER